MRITTSPPSSPPGGQLGISDRSRALGSTSRPNSKPGPPASAPRRSRSARRSQRRSARSARKRRTRCPSDYGFGREEGVVWIARSPASGPRSQISEYNAPCPQRDNAWAMSQENVEAVRRGYEAFNRGGVDAVISEGVWSPEIIWDATPTG